MRSTSRKLQPAATDVAVNSESDERCPDDIDDTFRVLNEFVTM